MMWEYIFYLLAGLSAVGIGLTLHAWWKTRWVRKAEEALPEMLETMASMLEKGFSIEYALSQLYKTGPPALKPYLKRVLRKVKKGTELPQALTSSLEELKESPPLQLSINLIAKGIEQGSPIASLLATIGSFQRKINLLEKEKKRRMLGAVGINLVLMPIMLGALSTVLKSMAEETPLLTFFVDMFMLYSIVAGSVAMALIYFLSRRSNTILTLLPFGAFLGFAPVYVVLQVM